MARVYKSKNREGNTLNLIKEGSKNGTDLKIG